MPAGPFDQRSRRSRCSACSSSHLKCDGATPCNHCDRRNITCTYQKANKLIKLDQAKVQTVVNFSNKQRGLVAAPRPQVLAPSPTAFNRHIYYFDIFAQRNNFVANTVSYDSDVKILLGTEPGHYLVHAVTALGALQSSRLSIATSQDDSRAAMRAYSSSVAALREAMAHATSPSHLHVLWTTLLLGLFELMNSDSGDGWLVHMVHGTGAALQASGPSACLSGPGQSFFLQARVFEVSRALLLGEWTFLSRPEWSTLSQAIRSDGQGSHRVLDELLDIIVQCSHLRVKYVFSTCCPWTDCWIRCEVRKLTKAHRTGEHLDSLKNESPGKLRYDVQELAMEGLQLRLALDTWRDSSLLEWNSITFKATPYDTNLITLCNIFFAAISIFLSGVFDYQVVYWRNLGLSIPTLPEEQIQRHVQVILELTAYALDKTPISPLLFLFSLRIAGARSYERHRQGQVLDLLTKIGQQFTIARVFRMELASVWQMRGSASPSP